MDDDEIYALTDPAAQQLYEAIPSYHLERLDEHQRDELLVDIHDSLTVTLRRAFGRQAPS